MKTLVFLTLLLLGMIRWAAAAPATLDQTVTYQGETITLRLTLQPLRGSHFELWSQTAAGTYDVVTPVAERSYLGSVDGKPGAVSCGVLLDNGQFKGAVYFDRGATWFTLGTSVVETRALGYTTFSDFQFPSAPTVTAGQAGTTMTGFDLAVDADNNYFADTGNNMATALEGIEYSVSLVRAIYMRDALIRPFLGRVIVRSTLTHDPYTGLNQGSYLDALRTEWNTNQTSADRDTVAGVSPVKIGGGLAWVGVIGSSSAYSVNQSNSNGNFDVVFRHELGHNWDCGHYVGGSPEGTGLMGGNAAGRFSGCEVYRVLRHRNNRLAAGGILDNLGTYSAVELPPYASLDASEFVQTITGPLTINVLANDHDANGQTITLTNFDRTTAHGGSVTQLGQNLIYSPSGSFLGTDSFTYQISDTAGRIATGAVVVRVKSNDPLRLYLPLDETSGTSTADRSIFKNDATLSGTDFNTSGSAGHLGNAVTLDGTDDHVAVSGVSLTSNHVTLTAWIKPGATQNPWAGIIFDRSGGAAGLGIGDNGELRYHWNNANWDWASGLTPPSDTWTFVALVIKQNQAIIYMNTGTGLQSAVHNGAHANATFATTYVGWDPAADSRHFAGGIDDVRIHDQSLSVAALQQLFNGGGASAPDPFDGATGVISPLLRWAPAATATGYDVYLGTSQSAVAAATRSSPEFLGTTTSTDYLASPADGTGYFWRIDTRLPSSTLAGSVWSFATGAVVAPKNSISVNFGRGGSEEFSGGVPIGPTAIDSSRWISTTAAEGSLSGLTDDSGASTPTTLQWYSSNTWGNNDGTSDDEERLAVGYLDDGDGSNGDGKGVSITLGRIPYANYRIYGLFTTDQADNGTVNIVNFQVNGTWALGGNSSTTAQAWGTIDSNANAHGKPWTRIVPGSVRGNYWMVESSGPTCTIIGQTRSGNNRGSLTGLIIEKIIPPNNPPTWESNPISATDTTEGVPYSASLAGKAGDPENDALTYAKVSGPAWLTVAADGHLNGTPGRDDIGSGTWLVSVADATHAPVQVTLHINILPDTDGDGIPDVTDPDDDNDGMPDAWEIAHSLDPLINDSAADPDSDGYSNALEHVADTGPHEANSRPTCAIVPGPGNAELTLAFPTSAQRNYTIQFSTDLTSGDWQNLLDPLPGTGSVMTITTTVAAEGRFYRIGITLP